MTTPLPPATTAVTESGHRRYTCPTHLERFVGSVTAYIPGEGERITLEYACGCVFIRQISRARARTLL